MKTAIKLEYKGIVYTSEYSETTEEEFNEIDNLVTLAVKGKLDYMTIINNSERYFFNKEILKESILTIKTK